MKELATELELLADELDELAEYDEEEVTYGEIGDWFMNSGSIGLNKVASKLRRLAKGIE